MGVLGWVVWSFIFGAILWRTERKARKRGYEDGRADGLVEAAVNLPPCDCPMPRREQEAILRHIHAGGSIICPLPPDRRH